MDMSFTLDAAAVKRREKRFEEAQDWLDGECIRLMEPLVPVALPYYHNAGALRDSAVSPQPGVIEYTAPKSKHDYYAAVDHHHGGNPQAQRMWFEVMKARHITELRDGVAKKIGG